MAKTCFYHTRLKQFKSRFKPLLAKAYQPRAKESYLAEMVKERCVVMMLNSF